LFSFCAFCSGADLDVLLQEEDWVALSNVNPTTGVGSNSNNTNNKITLKLGGLSEFAIHCIAGHYKRVQEMLEEKSVKTSGNSLKSMTQLLEKRETSLRLSPLLLVIAAGTRISEQDQQQRHSNTTSTMRRRENNKNMKSKLWKLPRPLLCHMNTNQNDDTERVDEDDHHAAALTVTTPVTALEKNQLQVIKVLLEYGARPDAKDLTGKTVVHYGAGVDATIMTLQAVNMCINASKSSFMMGKEIEVRDLTEPSNTVSSYSSKTIQSPTDMTNKKWYGKTGIAQGYIVDTNCRIVYLFGQKSEIRTIQPFQMKPVHKIQGPKPTRLCDIPDRMGRVPLLEILDTDRIDVAEFLIVRHQASIHVSTGWCNNNDDDMERVTDAADIVHHQRTSRVPRQQPTLLNEIILLRPNNHNNPNNNCSNGSNRDSYSNVPDSSSPVTELIYTIAIGNLRKEQKMKRNRCTQCQQAGTITKPLRVCEQWYVLL
jgi:hypothetical protein